VKRLGLLCLLVLAATRPAAGGPVPATDVRASAREVEMLLDTWRFKEAGAAPS